MKNLKIILQCRYLYIVISILSICYSLVVLNSNTKSKYSNNDKKITAYITNYYIDGNKLSLELKGLENIYGIYYFDSIDDLNDFKYNYKLGDEINLEGEMSIPSSNRVFNLFNYKKYLKSEGVTYVFKIENISKISDNKAFRYKIKNKIIESIERSINKDYLYTFILGNSKYIDSDVMDSYRINGISHLFAVSGMHVSLISMILLKLFDKFKYKNVLVIGVLLFYMFLTDYSPSIMRSGIMFILLFFNKKFNFKISTINIMLLLLTILIIIDPFIITKISFQYSYIISFYLILFDKIIKRNTNYFVKLFTISFIAFLASLPITINNFFSINVLSILLNIVFVPLISIIIFPMSLITVLLPIFDPLLNIFINIFEYLSVLGSSFSFLTFTMSKMGSIIFIFYYLVITFVLYMVLIKKHKYIVILAFIILLHNNITHFNYYSEITFIDVGQGDSSFIKLPNNKCNILIDTGGIDTYYYEEWKVKNNNYSIGEDNIIMYLKSIGIKKLDYLILTHGDTDHLGESLSIINNIKVDTVIFNYGNVNNNEETIIKVLENKNIKYYFYKEGDNIKIDNNEFLFVSPIKDYGNENDNSSVIYTKINNNKILFMGDAGVSAEKDILKKYNLGDIDILKVGHHGSNTSSSEYFINSINPKTCLISVGKNNKYGHPKEDVLEILNDCKIYRTDINGSIKIRLGNENNKVITIFDNNK